jgi:PAS domain S-box-containing protein
MNDQPSILIVDDDEGIRRTLEMILTKKNYQPVTAPDGKTALALAEERFFNLALLDVRLPDTTGTALLAQLKIRHPDLEALIVTGHATLETAVQALSNGAYHYFIKPINMDELLVTLGKALDKQRLVIENRQLLRDVQNELAERTRAEEALREHEATLQSIFRAAPTGIGLVADRVLLQVNDRVCEMMGRTREELVGQSAQILYATVEEFEHVGIEKYRQIREHGIGTVETRWQRKDGTRLDVLLSSVPLDPNDLAKGVTFAALDITERKRAEEALRASEGKLRAFFEQTGEGITIADGKGVVVEWNSAAEQITGLTRQQVIGIPVWEMMRRILVPERNTSESHSAMIAGIRDALCTGHAPFFGKPNVAIVNRPNGEQRCIEQSFFSISTGREYWLGTTSRDITERKRAEEALAAERNLLRIVIDNLPDRVYVKDTESRFLLNNPAHLQALGAKSQEQVIGKTDFDFRSKEHAERSMSDDRQVLESGCPLVNREEQSDLPTGEQRWLLATKVPLRDQQGNIKGLVNISRDITERKRAEELARIQRDLALTLSATFDLDEGLQACLAAALDVSGMDSGGFYLWNEAQGTLDLAFHRGLSADFIAAKGHLEAGSPNTRSVVAGKPIYTNYCELDVPAKALYENLRAMAIIPFRHEDRILGCLNIASHTVDEIPRVSRNALETIAAQVGNAIARLKAEQALRAAEANYRSLFENVPDGVFRTTLDGQILAANPALVRLLGYASAQELLSIDNVADLYVDPAVRAAVAAQLMQAGEIRNAEVTLRRKDGRQIIVLDNARAVCDPRGTVTYFEGTLTDVTERKQHERELLAVAAVSAALRTAPTRAEMLPVILDQVQALLNTDAASIIMREPSTGEAVVEVGCGIWSGGVEFRIPPGKGISGRVFETGQSYVTNDLPNDPYYFWHDQMGYLTALAMVPLIVQGNVVGALNLGRVTPFAPEEVNLVSAIADITANALHRAALHEKTEQQLQYLVALRTVDQTINASLDLRFTLNVLLDQIITQLRVDAADVLLHNPSFQTLEYAAGRGFRTKGNEQRSWRLGEGYAGVAALERRVVIIRHLAHATQREPAPAPPSEGFVSYVGIPLIAKGKIKGVLEIFHRSPLRADAEWLNFFEMLAGQAEIAIDNAQLFEELQRAHSNLVLSYDAMIEGWSRALDLRDEETEGHAQRVVELTERLARAVGVGEAELIHIRRGALLHDIGKIGVPDHILRKPTPLTQEEWVIMRRHPVFAHNLLKPIPYLQLALDIPYCHHEKWDGTGYPRGLKGKAIPLAARIFALVDVWDALRSVRPYREAWPEEQVRAYMVEQAGKHFDPELLGWFMKIVR